MRTIPPVKLALLAFSLSLIMPNYLAHAQSSLAGEWQGTIDANGTPMRLVWHVTAAADGSVTSTFDNVDEGILGIKTKSVNLKGSDLTVQVEDTITVNGQELNLKGSVAGTVSADGNDLTGTWTQTDPQPQDPVQLHLKRAAASPAAAPATAQASAPVNIVGDWKGVLMDQLHLVLHITAGKDGVLAATLDSIDQNAPGIPVSSVTLKDGKLSLTVDAVQPNGSYEGTVSKDGTTIDGTWTQGQAMPLKFTRAGAV